MLYSLLRDFKILNFDVNLITNPQTNKTPETA